MSHREGPSRGALVQADRILEALVDAVVDVSGDGVIRYVNAAAERLLGWERDELVGRPATELVPLWLRTPQQRALEHYRETGESRFFERPVHMSVLARGGELLPVDLRLSGLDPSGREGFVAVLRPVADSEDATDHATASFLAEVGVVLASSLDYDATLSNVAGLAVPLLADWCAVDLLERDGSVRRIAVTHADPASVELARSFQRFSPDPEGDNPVARCLRTGQPKLFPRLARDWLEATAADDTHLKVLEQAGFVSEIIVPLSARGRTLGAMSLATAESGRRYDRNDLVVAEDLARRAALAVDNAQLLREARESAERFEAIVEGVDAVLWEADADTVEIRFISHRVEGLLGYPIADWLEDPSFWERHLHPDDRGCVVDRSAEFAAARRDYDLAYRMVAADGRHVWIHDVVHIEPAADGSALLRGFMVDITDRKQAQDELRYQHALLEAQAEASVEGFVVVSPEGRILSYNRRFIDLWPIPEDVIESRSDEAALASVLDKLVDPAGFLRRVRQVYASPDAPSDEELHLRDGRVFERHGAPLRDEEGTYHGWAWYFRDVTEQRRTQEQLRETGERFASLARTLQRSLLPPALPNVPGLDLGARYLAAAAYLDVGGDFYDVFRNGAGGWAVVMGDVCGKGAEAATMTALARYTVQAAAMHVTAPDEVLALLNEALLRSGGGERFVTAVYGTITTGRGRVELLFAAGGHPLPLIVRDDGTVEEAGTEGMLMGAFPDATTTNARVLLESGDALVLFTDGVLDATAEGGEPFGERRLRALLGECTGADADEIAERIERAIRDHGRGAPMTDDTAVLVLRARPD